jgi:fatty-acyl-CoA synthase
MTPDSVRHAVTATQSRIPMRLGDFSSLAEALDYASDAGTGFNFFAGRGDLTAAVDYGDLRNRAVALARRLGGLDLARGECVAVMADTTPEFAPTFFACQYAGLTPVPLSAALRLGGGDAYVRQLRHLLTQSGARVAIGPGPFLPWLARASDGLGLRFVGDVAALEAQPETHGELRPLEADELAYIQYTSGTTATARGVAITQRAVLSNLAAILQHGLRVRPGDRCTSWLPYYHDMGLVGFVLAPMAAQLSVDYLRPSDFALRPQQWLTLVSRMRSTIAFGPTFGYDLCARRVRGHALDGVDLRSWRVAGVGAEMIRPDVLDRFADAVAATGFDRRAFLACYGMAECSLAVSFAALGRGVAVDDVDAAALEATGRAVRADRRVGTRTARFTCCGVPLPGHEVEIRDDRGRALPERRCGRIVVRGPSVMVGYADDPELTRETLSRDGWLDTGDLGYLVDGGLVVTGRRKDVLIIHGRNIWPQELERVATAESPTAVLEAAAFSVPDVDGAECAVVVLECRDRTAARQRGLIERIQARILEEFAVACAVDLVPPRTLPRTSSGKLARAAACREYLARVAGRLATPAATPARATAAGGSG